MKLFIKTEFSLNGLLFRIIGYGLESLDVLALNPTFLSVVAVSLGFSYY